MGWQDDPIVESRPAWEKDPVVGGTRPSSPDSAVAINSANRAIAGVGDTLLNAPANIINLLKAGVGTAAVAAGRPDFAPEPTEPPNLANRAMRSMGFINDAEPANARQRLADAVIRGGVGAVLGPANGVKQAANNLITGGVSSAAGQGAKEMGAPDAIGDSISMLAPVAMNAQTARTRARAESEQSRANENAVRDKTLADAREAGLVVPPSSANPSIVNKILEGWFGGGRAAVRQDADSRNQAATNRLAAEELGFPKDTAITESKLADFRYKKAAPYREVSSLSPQAQDYVERLKQSRYEANAYHKAYQRSADPEQLATAKANDRVSELLEMQLEGIAARSGKPQLVDSLREARKEIAKSWDIERSLNLGDAGVSAPTLGRSLDNGRPLTGNLETIAKFQQAFPDFAREGAKTPVPGVTALGGAKAAGYGAAGFSLGGPFGAAVAALPLTEGPVRSMLLSKGYNNLMGKPKYNTDLLPEDQAAIQAVLIKAALDARKEGKK